MKIEGFSRVFVNVDKVARGGCNVQRDNVCIGIFLIVELKVQIE